MTNDIQMKKPYTVNQVSNSKPNVPRTTSVLSGYIANSMNGGHNKVIAFKKVMAGERHKEYRLKANFQMLTPKTPTYQNLRITIRAYFVPNSRVWENAEKYTAQKKTPTEEQILEIPNIGGKILPTMAYNGSNAATMNIVNTDIWRDSFASTYIPRMGQMSRNKTVEPGITPNIVMPKMSVLPLRGRIAIYNDMERNKEYDELVQEYNSDTVSDAEFNSYMPTNPNKIDFYHMRAKKENSYYTDYRTQIQGFDIDAPWENVDNPINESNSLITWASWESKIAEARSEAENAQMNDWDIIAKIRGSKILTEGKVIKIGQKTFNLNYSAITQNTYNNNEEIQEDFRVLGKQGAYSYTEINTPIYAGMEFKEEGYVHIIATISADTVFESAIDRNELNVRALDEYRPDLVGEKYDVLYKIETGTTKNSDILNEMIANNEIVGYKRKFSEYFKLPNIIGGDMTTKNYYKTIISDGNLIWENSQIITQKTFQFFEEDQEEYYERNSITNTKSYSKDIWKDYTDLMINKNQAILNEMEFTGVITEEEDLSTYTNARIKGQNQVFFVGVCTCLADLPIDEEIKSNYTTWGEH